jgi:hypothetical protein
MASRFAVFCGGAVAVALRLLCITRYRIDSDEPQHLHVAWLWSRGLVGYRDFFDNHTPLFHVLSAPMLRAIGETPRILLLARLLMLPLAAVSLFVVYRIAAHAYGREAGAWTCLCAAVFPPLLLRSVEFRNDNLFVLWSLLALAMLLEPLTPRRAAILGGIVGLSLLTSVKTLFVAAALGAATVVVDGVTLSIAAAAVAGFTLPIAASLLWFGQRDALPSFGWCTIAVNSYLPMRPWWPAVGAIGVALSAIAVWLVRKRLDIAREKRLAAAAAVFFISIVFTFSPFLSPREFLPVFPLLLMFAVAALMRAGRYAAPVAMAILAIASVVIVRPWEDPDPYPEHFVAQVIALTQASEPVLDLKGESIFRVRPSYMVLEDAGRNAIAHGHVRETFAHDVISHRCYVAVRDNNFFPPATRAFLNHHFLPVGDLRVAGSVIAADRTFEIGVPGPYTTVAADGRPIDSRAWYEPGVYRSPGSGHAIVWSGAVERGVWPRTAG